jgi:sortase (surface protein transpeptidase)
MRLFRSATSGDRRGLIATAVTGVLALAGVAGIGMVFFDQNHAPEPPLTVAPETTPSAAAIAPSKAPLASPTAIGPVLKSSTPVSISIPAIGVQSYLLRLGRSANGALEVPPQGPTYNMAGWYKYSPTPGALGPSVIAGHVDSAADGPSVFYKLGGLHAGDEVRVARTDGQIAIFKVNDVRRYEKAAFPTALVYGNTNRAALRLITCGGPFDTSTGHYTDNIVVWASLVGAIPA